MCCYLTISQQTTNPQMRTWTPAFAGVTGEGVASGGMAEVDAAASTLSPQGRDVGVADVEGWSGRL